MISHSVGLGFGRISTQPKYFPPLAPVRDFKAQPPGIYNYFFLDRLGFDGVTAISGEAACVAASERLPFLSLRRQKGDFRFDNLRVSANDLNSPRNRKRRLAPWNPNPITQNIHAPNQ